MKCLALSLPGGNIRKGKTPTPPLPRLVGAAGIDALADGRVPVEEGVAGDEADDDAGEELERVRHDDEHGEVAEEQVHREARHHHQAPQPCSCDCISILSINDPMYRVTYHQVRNYIFFPLI